MAINFTKVGFTYQVDTPFATPGLYDVNFTMPENQFTAVIGHTGSGKSTMVQLLDGLVLPNQGQIKIAEMTLDANTKASATNQIRRHVGLVFQFPEAQLFEQTVLQDVMFGPKNFGKTDVQAKAIAIDALRTVGMAEKFDQRSPFELSGGQMRRVAIAGVLALEPEILILDEPTAGLDPQGQNELMALFARLQRERQMTLILVTHQMEFVAQYADHVVVFENGTVVKEGDAKLIFSDAEWLQNKQLDVPMAKKFADALAGKGVLLDNVLNIDALVAQLVPRLKEAQHVQ
ncbi:energy-coupling factor transporter ATPase [Weissella diestrammenae]|uniref:Energy-coupling factor transporter ATP-binding protein EcfA2 n=1 Tax=Weissella diestrammenae TaxID=1162633 RepID=A0A7G9T3I4_9LACO|nr:energy-coupling factor transporter ATPase [Weissella diestrammenae]MCM0582630.1 energy-coupling factor transporter ATPase [Weissella diestrammenae]QNN74659.1 energy-coupling factor transporter ATPase [Weissella diestrammenae]